MDYPDKLGALNAIYPLLKSLKGQRIVIKYGGAAMKDKRLTEQVVKNIILLQDLGLQCIVVHGGGPAINQLLDQLHVEPKFNQGIRVTNSHTMEVVQMVLAGKVNKNIVALLSTSGARAIGLSGHDNWLIKALPISLETDDRVANVDSINTDFLELLIDNKYIPVIAPIGIVSSGISYNINADIIASSVASELNADMLVMLTDTPGILKDPKDSTTLLENLTISQVNLLIEEAVIVGGMIPKVQACLNALKNGVKITKVIDGRKSNSLILSLMNESTLGTSIISGE
uniref:Acetylglutamate kinase n=1 Tax=Liagora brachyclada TaxID=1884665 RepID=A0A1G4P053_9FLOR|nr:Acetylglutamate kinase [Liagora brachyclada]SCW24280.1 Acetylglutamate kinase [Liagora brachyclada]